MEKTKKQAQIIEAQPNVTVYGREVKAQRRVAAYCRVSTDSEEQKTSYTAQIDEYRKKITSNPDWTFVGIYADEGISGTSTAKRPDFNRMISDCKSGMIDLIVTKSISRFSRNVEECIKTVRMLKTLDVEVYFESSGIYTFDNSSELVFNILASIAQAESCNISENITWGIQKRMRDGVAIVNHNRFLGYTKDENGELVIDPEEAKTIRYIFNRYMQGAGYIAIARELEEKGVLTGAGNTHWSSATVSGILKNEKYCGDLLLQKTLTTDYLSHKRINNDKHQATQYFFKDDHEPIIPKEIWLAVQKKRDAKYLLNAGKDKNKDKYQNKYAFSGKLICENCGCVLKRRVDNPNKPYARDIWQCYDYLNKGRRTCNSKAVGDITLKKAFIKMYNEIIKNEENFFANFIKVIERVVGKSDNEKEFNNILKEIETVEKRIGHLIDMNTDGILTVDDFKREYERYSEQRIALVAQKNDMVSEQISGSERLRKISVIRELIKSNNNLLTEFDDSLFKALVEKVIVTNPITFKFVLINGIEIPVDATEFHDGRKYKNRAF